MPKPKKPVRKAAAGSTAVKKRPASKPVSKKAAAPKSSPKKSPPKKAASASRVAASPKAAGKRAVAKKKGILSRFTKTRGFIRSGINLKFFSFMAVFAVIGTIGLLVTSANTTAVSVNDNTIGTGFNQFAYSSGWGYTQTSGAFGNDEHYSPTANTSYTVKFSGTQIKAYSMKHGNYGIAGYSIDGGPETLVDHYAPTRVHGFLAYTSPVLANTTHTLKVRVTGTKSASSSSTYVAADRVEVITTTSTPNPPPPPPPPPTTGGTIDVNNNTRGTADNQFNFSAGWGYTTTTGAYANDEHYSNGANTTYTVKFNGTQIKAYSMRHPNYGIAGYSIDGGPETMVDHYAPSRQFGFLAYTSPVLTSGSHTLKVRVTGTKQAAAAHAYIAADRVQITTGTVTPPPPANPPPPPPPPPTSGGPTIIRGINGMSYRETRAMDRNYQLYTEGNIQATRIDLAWDQLQPNSKGVWDAGNIARLDRFMNEMKARNVKVLAIVYHSPKWANGNQNTTTSVNFRDSDFTDFVGQIMDRYGDKIEAYEVWNEPTFAHFWSGNSTRYIQLLKATHAKIKSKDPTRKVVAPAIFEPFHGNLTWIRDMYAQGAKNSFDVLSVHSYGDTEIRRANNKCTRIPCEASRMFGTIKENVLSIMQANGDGSKEIWLTETGVALNANGGNTEAEQAEYVRDMLTTLKQNTIVPNMKRIYWYSMTEAAANAADPNYAEHHFGLVNVLNNGVNASDYVPKPSFNVLKSQ